MLQLLKYELSQKLAKHAQNTANRVRYLKCIFGYFVFKLLISFENAMFPKNFRSFKNILKIPKF